MFYYYTSVVYYTKLNYIILQPFIDNNIALICFKVPIKLRYIIHNPRASSKVELRELEFVFNPVNAHSSKLTRIALIIEKLAYFSFLALRCCSKKVNDICFKTEYLRCNELLNTIRDNK